ncbi:PREDICTED: uncharacterized protein LOC105365819 [Ceratosolen solmsi marchali]|uniref:Uncharacterized protein LOC105365819 n=1 Tax=Ceratosolen solmsi marchali TaxID=326594 RepID=A0AAJ7DZR2_9HYME|nr:PREDICTED: uncharacterized protein LOC105365819 [Ceratosolen solmsi marchali]
MEFLNEIIQRMMLILLRERVITFFLLLLLMSPMLYSHESASDTSKKTTGYTRSIILANLWNRFDLGWSLPVNSLYSQKQEFTFRHFDSSTTINTAVSFLAPDKSKTSIADHITTVNTANQMPIQIDIMTVNQRFTRSLETNVIKIDTVTVSSSIDNITRRYRREDQNNCYKFEEGDPVKKEFYSPNYPEPYPKNISCFKVLEADPGMVIKVEFRDNFELEDQENCTYDFLEVRDGKYGYSRFIGKFCRAFPFPEITSSSRYLWLYFQSDNSIQGIGFRAVWSMVPRPAVKTPESVECLLNVTNLLEYEIKTSEITAQKRIATELGTELDCIWNITVPEGWKIQMTFPQFHLDKPNECDINYVQIYDKEPSKTNNPSLINNFCGSIADLVTSKGNEAYLRFFVTKAAMNSSFEAIMTAVREKESKDKGCNIDEFDCQDACISDKLRCNHRPNCRYRFDEDADICNTKSTGLNVNSEHVIIILIVFTLLMSGLCFTFILNCVKKLIRDHRIIKEHIRQSRENRLDEFGRKASPCLITELCTEIGNNDQCHSNELPTFEVLSKPKELISHVTINGQDYEKEQNMRLSVDLNDIHQSNNVSNATQERLQESSEEREMHDMECQTRESLFASDFILKPAHPEFTTFSFQTPNYRSKLSFDYYPIYEYRDHTYPHQQSQSYNYYQDDMNQQVIKNNFKTLPEKIEQDPIQRQYSTNYPSNQLSSKLCLKHSSTPIVPAPPGWSSHGSTYNSSDRVNFQRLSITSSTKVTNEESKNSFISRSNKISPNISIHKKISSSDENYECTYDNTEKSHSVSSGSISQRSGIAKPIKCPQKVDSQFTTEAVIEVDKKRPFSIESTKSAPDVIATH